MLTTRSPRPLRLLTVLALALAPAGAVVLTAAPPAAAVPCNPDVNPNCPPPSPITYHSSLTVTPPSRGTIVGRNTATNTTVFSCSAGGGTCTHTDAQSSTDGRPTDGWPEYAFTLDAASAPGYAVTFSGACAGDTSCTATNDATSATLTATIHDIQPPSVGVSPLSGTRVKAGTVFTATATDNDTVASYAWWVCPIEDACGASLGTNSTFAFPAGRTAGGYRVEVRAADASGNQAFAYADVTLVTSVDMTSSDVPAYAQHPSFTFSSSNEEAHVPADNQHRRCRAWADGASTPDWDVCTTANSYAPALAPGSYTLQAEEIDDLGLVGLVSHHVVVPGPATLVPTAAQVRGTYGRRTALAVTVGPDAVTGTVRFASGSTVLCTATVSAGRAACLAPATVGAGRHAVTASYAGNFLGSSAGFVLNVAKAATSLRLALPRSARHGSRVTVRITGLARAATGVVAVTRSGHTLCSAHVRAGAASCRMVAPSRPGSYPVLATYRGDRNHAASHRSGRLRVT